MIQVLGGYHFAYALYQINTLYTLNLHNVMSQLHFNKSGGKYLLDKRMKIIAEPKEKLA